MNILIILGHPDVKSFNHAIAQVCIETIVKNGHSVMFHDLYAENFNPVISKQELFAPNCPVDKITEQHRADLINADAILIIHPNWWGQPPAIIKGWIDRILVQGIAYKFVENKTVCLLKAKIVFIFNTSNTDERNETEFYKDTLDTLWKNRIFNFIGIHQVLRKNFRIVKESNQIQRTAWLQEVNEMIDAFFKNNNLDVSQFIKTYSTVY